nr:hypothetical protein B14D6.210 [imported] - Neurospora crassa [Neurospora crassa]
MFLLGNVYDRFSRFIPAAQKNSWGQRRHLEWLHSVYKDAQFLSPTCSSLILTIQPAPQAFGTYSSFQTTSYSQIYLSILTTANMQLASVLATLAALKAVTALPSASTVEVAKVVTGASVSADEIPDAMKFNPPNATDATALASRASLDKRASLGVYICKDAPFVASTCQHIFSNPNECSMWLRSFRILWKRSSKANNGDFSPCH